MEKNKVGEVGEGGSRLQRGRWTILERVAGKASWPK